MMTTMRRRATMLGSVILAAALVHPLEAQLPNPSAAALGMGENHTAAARGWSAIAFNPAGLAMPDGPAASATLFAMRGVGGLGPIGLGDVAEYGGEFLPEEVRQRWLDRIVAAGGEHGSAGAELTYLAAQFGRVGLQAATSAHLVGNVGAGAAELIFFGNAGRTGEAVDLALGSTAFDVAMTSTVALSYAQPILREVERSLSVGATLKYTIGHVMLTGVDLGSESTADPLGIRIDLPIVQTDSALSFGGQDRGAGVGLDLGLAWRGGPVRAGIAVKNVFNSFGWNESNLFFRAGAVSVEGSTTETNWEPQPFSAAPAPVRQRVRELAFPMVVSAGVALDATSSLRVSADARQRLGEGQPWEPATHVGLGAEFRPLGWLPLRAGGALVSEGYLLSGGMGLDLRPVGLDAAIARRRDDHGTSSVVMFSFSLESN